MMPGLVQRAMSGTNDASSLVERAIAQRRQDMT
jgi:hypothetical protein